MTDRNSNAHNMQRVAIHAIALGVAAFVEQALYTLVEIIIAWVRGQQRKLTEQQAFRFSAIRRQMC